MKKEFSENGVFEMIAQKLVPKNELSKLSKTQLQGLQILIEKYGGKEVNYELPNVVYSLDWTGFKQEACGEHPEKLLLLLQDYFEICEKEREIRSRKRIRSRSLQDFREELRFARDEALDNVQKEVFRAIDEVRIAQKIDIVFQDYISASQRVDITPLVLEYLKQKINKQPVTSPNKK